MKSALAVEVCLQFAALIALCYNSLSNNNNNNDNTWKSTPPRRRKLFANNVLFLQMGLPRSGSLGVHEFLQCMGVSSAHYCCDGTNRTAFPCQERPCGQCIHALLSGKKNEKECSNRQALTLDVETGEPFAWFLPQHYAIPLLYETYPEATWILTQRKDAEQWSRSVLHWYSETRRLFRTFNLDYYSNDRWNKGKIGKVATQRLTEQGLRRDLNQSLRMARSKKEHERRVHLLKNVYERHNQRVRNFAKRANVQLVQVNVDDYAQAGLQLARALGWDDHRAAACWSFNVSVLDDDWQDFTFRL